MNSGNSKSLKTALITAAAFAVLSAPSGLAADQASWKSFCDQGDEAMQAETPARAEQQFRKAIALVKKQSKNPADLDKCSLKLVQALKLQNKTGEARSILQAMSARLTRSQGADSAAVEPVLMELGSIEESAGNHSVAMNYYNRALSLTEKHYGPYTPEAAKALHGLGRVNGKTGHKDEAVANYKRAITILSKEPNREAAEQLKFLMHDYSDLIKGDDSSNTDLIKDFQNDILKDKPPSDPTPPSSSKDLTGTISVNPGQITSGSDSTNESKSLFQKESESRLQSSRAGETGENERVALRGIHLPSSDSTLKPAFKVVSDTVFSQSRYRLSESQYQRMIAIDVDSLGPSHPSVGNDINGLAQLYIAQGRYNDAKPLLSRALGIYESAYGGDNVLTINTLAALASVEFHLNNVDQSTKLYRRALTGAQEVLGPNSLETARILNGMAYLYFHQGELDRACTFYEWAVASTERAVGTTDPLLAACLKDYAQVLRRMDKETKAAEIEARAGQILAQSKGL